MRKIIAIDHDSDVGEGAGTGGDDDDDNKFEVVGHGGGTEASNRDTRLVNTLCVNSQNFVFVTFFKELPRGDCRHAEDYCD